MQDCNSPHFIFRISTSMVTSRDSSVGRAADCRGLRSSVGHWFDSGSRDFLLKKMTLNSCLKVSILPVDG